MRRRQKVAAETTGFVIRRRHGPAMPPPHALPEAPPTALSRLLFLVVGEGDCTSNTLTLRIFGYLRDK